MIPYEPYDDTECPRCGNTGNNRDAGPYEYIPWLDDALGGAPDPRVHLMWCGNCGKPFDVAPQELADAAMPELAAHYPDACPSGACHPGDSPATVPVRVYEKRGRHLAEYQGTCGHRWVTRWGHRFSSEAALRWPIERELVGEFPSERDAAVPADALEALVGDLGDGESAA